MLGSLATAQPLSILERQTRYTGPDFSLWLASPANVTSAAAPTTTSTSPSESPSSTFIAAFGAHGNLTYPLTLGVSIGAGILVLLAILGLSIFLHKRRTRSYKRALPRGRQTMVDVTSEWPYGVVVEAPTKPARGYVRLGSGEVLRFDEPETRQSANTLRREQQQQPNEPPSSDGPRRRASSFVERFDV